MRKLNNHKNLIKLYEVHETINSIYMVMELLQGGQLLDKMQNNLTEDEIIYIIKGILEGISHIHEKNIMHRDLKPENILFRNEYDLDPVIVDFGLATFNNDNNYLFPRCGTPGYVAPEIANLKNTENVQYSVVCDIFSVGIILDFL